MKYKFHCSCGETWEKEGWEILSRTDPKNKHAICSYMSVEKLPFPAPKKERKEKTIKGKLKAFVRSLLIE